MNKTNYTLLFILLFCGYLYSGLLKAQVTVGKDSPPEKYSILQVDHDASSYPNGAGVLLPRLSLAQRTSLMNKILDDGDAIGLTIYNTSSDKVEYWNGEDWIPILGGIIPSFDAKSGLNRSNLTGPDIIKLGGSLLKPTDISLNGHQFTIEQEEDTHFKAGPMIIKDDKVGIGLTSSDPTTRLHIARSAPDNGLRISDGSEGTNKVMTAIDADGFGEWRELEDVITVEKGIIKSSGSVGYSGTTISYTKISTTDVTCDAGRWLIIARFMSLNSTNSTNYYSWIKLQTVPTSGTGTVLSVSGLKTEPKGYSFSIPEIVYYGEFSSTTKIGLWGGAPGSSATLGSFGGAPFLIAIKLANL